MNFSFLNIVKVNFLSIFPLSVLRRKTKRNFCLKNKPKVILKRRNDLLNPRENILLLFLNKGKDWSRESGKEDSGFPA